MVTHERTALVVSGGAHEQLAASALRLIDDPAVAQRMIQQGREECRKYEWEAVRDQWLNAYHDLACGSMAGQIGPERKTALTTTAETDRRA
jgi:glycosyltransferase involved in cell wall biosynthesis